MVEQSKHASLGSSLLTKAQPLNWGPALLTSVNFSYIPKGASSNSNVWLRCHPSNTLQWGMYFNVRFSGATEARAMPCDPELLSSTRWLSWGLRLFQTFGHCDTKWPPTNFMLQNNEIELEWWWWWWWWWGGWGWWWWPHTFLPKCTVLSGATLSGIPRCMWPT